MFYLWLRRQVRKIMSPIPKPIAEKYNNNLTVVYVFCAWSMFGIVMYELFLRKVDNASKMGDTSLTAKWYGRAFRAENMKIYTISNGRVVEGGTYKYEEDILPAQPDKDFFGADSKQQ